MSWANSSVLGLTTIEVLGAPRTTVAVLWRSVHCFGDRGLKLFQQVTNSLSLRRLEGHIIVKKMNKFLCIAHMFYFEVIKNKMGTHTIFKIKNK